MWFHVDVSEESIIKAIIIIFRSTRKRKCKHVTKQERENAST